ncbi:hypothetical protein AB0F92_31380 [Kitasatospora aureofaciens]|nr:hypothetical protein BOQ63_008005 [Streptomyces viridifaciens]
MSSTRAPLPTANIAFPRGVALLIPGLLTRAGYSGKKVERAAEHAER